MNVSIDRDPVSAGDDLDPHNQTITVPEGSSTLETLLTVLRTGYLPKVGGGPVAWIIEVDGEPVGAVASSDSKPELVTDADGPFHGSRIFFRYETGADVEQVLRRIR